jgi:phosphatidate phosphatase APP1
VILCLLSLAVAWEAPAAASNVKRDEEIVFFPGLGWRAPGAKAWQLEVRGCVYEPESRRLGLGLLRRALELKGVDLEEAEARTLTTRARGFMVDHEGGRRVVISIGSKTFNLGKCGEDGAFERILEVQDAVVRAASTPTTLRFSAVLPKGDARVFEGELVLVPESGLLVVSDIDDTIKVTGVADHKTLLRRTFLEPMEPVAGMADLYRRWADERQARFCYLSGSPWQLFLPLSDFRRRSGFPPGGFYLRRLRWTDASALDVLTTPKPHKEEVLERLMQRFPQHRFILVGDSGEQDPEIYAGMAARHRHQVEAILIRDVTGEGGDSERYQALRSGLRAGQFQVFTNPGGIVLPGKGGVKP